MGKHETGYARVEPDLYPTPPWVVAALAEHVDLRGLTVWEPACGDGRMVEVLRQQGCARDRRMESRSPSADVSRGAR
jgi:hypothetical protein